jgi:hypothetical protein
MHSARREAGGSDVPTGTNADDRATLFEGRGHRVLLPIGFYA